MLAAALLLLAAAPAAAQPVWMRRLERAAWARAPGPETREALALAALEATRRRDALRPGLELGQVLRVPLAAPPHWSLDGTVTVPLVQPAGEVALATARLEALRARGDAEQRALQRVHQALSLGIDLQTARRRLAALRSLDAASRPYAPWLERPGRAPPAVSADALAVALLLQQADGQRRALASLSAQLAPYLRVPTGPLPYPWATAEADGFPGEEVCLRHADLLRTATLDADARRLRSLAEVADALPTLRLAIGAGADLDGTPGDAGSVGALRARLSLRIQVRLPPWSAASGESRLTLGSAGLEHRLTLRWPNPYPTLPPGPVPTPTRSEALAEARREVRRRWGDLRATLRALRGRAQLLERAVPEAAGLAALRRRAELLLDLADTRRALALVTLDARALCGIRPLLPTADAVGAVEGR
jgi:hypothetical protein